MAAEGAAPDHGNRAAACGADDLHPLHPATRSGTDAGTWRDYYRRWRAFTRDRLDPQLLDLVEPLKGLSPPAEVVDKRFYSGFAGTDLGRRLERRGIRTLIVTGGETDVCVLATTMSAVDRGYSVVLVTDALCSALDGTHDALLKLYRERFTGQIETATTEQVLRAWS